MAKYFHGCDFLSLPQSKSVFFFFPSEMNHHTSQGNIRATYTTGMFWTVSVTCDIAAGSLLGVQSICQTHMSSVSVNCRNVLTGKEVGGGTRKCTTNVVADAKQQNHFNQCRPKAHRRESAQFNLAQRHPLSYAQESMFEYKIHMYSVFLNTGHVYKLQFLSTKIAFRSPDFSKWLLVYFAD